MESTVAQKTNLLDLLLKVWLDWNIPIGRIWGIPIYIHIFSGIGLFFWLNLLKGHFDLQWIYLQTIEFLILSCSLAVHELMHALVAKYLKKEVAGMIFILPIMAMAFVGQDPRRPGRDIWIYLAGPLSNLIISGIVLIISMYALDESTWMMIHLIRFALEINIAIAVFNLLPFFPLDGGRLFKDLLLIVKIRERYAKLITLAMAWVCFLGLVYLSLSVRAYGTLIIISLLMTASVLSLTGVSNLKEQTT